LEEKVAKSSELIREKELALKVFGSANFLSKKFKETEKLF
jgi:hypothetical protein